MNAVSKLSPTLRFTAVATIVATSLLAGACSSDTPAPTETSISSTGVQTNSPSDTGTRPAGGAIAGIRIAPQRLAIAVGVVATVGAYPVDANGVPSLALLAGTPTWSVSNAAVASINNGAIRGLAVGTTKVYATWGAYRDSSIVEVTAAGDTVIVRDSSRTGGGGTPTTPVPSFSLTTYVFGRAAAPTPGDTANVVQLSGATVSVYRLSANPAAPSDSLGVRTLVQTVVADGNGKAVFNALSSGFYSVSATATYAGAAYEGRQDFGPPAKADFPIALYLVRK